MAKRYQRRTTRPIEDLPSLFSSEDRLDAPFEVVTSYVAKHRETQSPEELAVPDEAIKPHDSLRFISFGSGSSGNCAYIGTRHTGLLIDAGVDNDIVTQELAKNGIDISTIRGILITHDHADHVRYAYALLRRNTKMSVYTTPKTLSGILRRHSISRRIKDYHKAIYKEFPFKVDDFEITAFETSHDGTDNMGFSITAAGTTFVVVTDTGIITERADYYMRQANNLMIESNYDLDMLIHGHYPEYLKARIRSNTGHLDNADCAAYLAQICSPSLRNIFLCHLSEDNNTPDIAISAARNAIAARGMTVGDGSGSLDDRKADVHLVALPRFTSSDLFVFRP